jgi:hypothetical protein
MVMVLTILVLYSTGKGDNSILGRADLALRFPAESITRFQLIGGLCVPIRSGADGDHGNGNGVGDSYSDYSTRSI